MRCDWRDTPVMVGLDLEIRTSLSTPEVLKLVNLATNRRVIEFGSAFGYSAIKMAYRAINVVAVDPHQWIRDSERLMLENIQRSGLTQFIEVRVQTSAAAFEQLETVRSFDLVFIDGDHDQRAVTLDYTYALGLLPEKGGIIACHDYGEDTCPGVKAALDGICEPDEIVDTLWIKRIGL
jgi:predicted O-methyltransferase YrrM